MEEQPTLTHYVDMICTLFDEFEQEQQNEKTSKRGCPVTFADKMFIVFFIIMQFRRIRAFKAQNRWLKAHPEIRDQLGWERTPHRKTISTRFKRLDATVQQFLQFNAQHAAQLDEAFKLDHLAEDKSLFKAQGPVWHQSDRKEGRVPDGLRNLDQEATWSKSGYHGWVYGYGAHLTCNQAAFPVLMETETANVSETTIIDRKESTILATLQPLSLSADDSYTQASRIRRWASSGVALLTPAFKWKTGRYAKAYREYIKQPEVKAIYRHRKTSVEPFFDLLAKVIGTTARQKQLAVKGLSNVRSTLSLGTLSIQIAMIMNSIWGLPLRKISVMSAAFT